MIVLAGDSYSRAQDKSFMPCPKYSWAGNMIRTHGGYGIGAPGSTNLDILKSLIPYKDLQCPFIINFSHLVRGSRNFKNYTSTVNRLQNLEAAQKTIDIFADRALFWTPFPGYEKVSKIQSIFLLEDDELWLNRDETGVLRGFTDSQMKKGLGVLGNHLTSRGNDYLFNYFSKWLETHPLYKKSEPLLFCSKNYNTEPEQTAWTNLSEF